MVAVARNLGEKPLFYAELITNADGTVSFKLPSGKFASQQPTAGQPYENAYGYFKFVSNCDAWERGELKGAIVAFTVNGERFGYVVF